jgi:A/G-specific adenine glycosylase
MSARTNDVRSALLRWFEPRRAAYPWRGTGADPYRVLVSEVMLQQTQAARVAPAFVSFTARFPTVQALAVAPRSAVVRAWDGLGYNRRAVALSEAARRIVRDHAGAVPDDIGSLEALPGVGPYTASAVAAIAYGVPVPAIDTNVRRVVARARLGRPPGDVDPGEIRAAAEAWLDPAEPGTWNQAVMDLGRLVCGPKPRCEACPIAGGCGFVAAGAPAGVVRHSGQGRFVGSSREARGLVVRALRHRSAATHAALVRDTGLAADRVADAVRSLARDGVVDVSTGSRTAKRTAATNAVVRLAD